MAHRGIAVAAGSPSTRTLTLPGSSRLGGVQYSTAAFGTENAALTILYGLVAFGQIRLRKIDGAQYLPAFIAKAWQNVA